MGLALTSRTINKYFGFLRRLDNGSKKRLIISLTESIKDKEEKMISLRDLSGAWEDSRDSDKIIEDIRNSRTEKHDNFEF